MTDKEKYEEESMKEWTIKYLENRVLNSSNIDEQNNCKKAVLWLKESEDEKIFDTLLNRSDKLSHFVELYQLKLAS